MRCKTLSLLFVPRLARGMEIFISSLIGDIVETVYVLIVGHQFMRRSSFVLGPFSLVWGLGAVILTLALSKVRK